MHCLCGPSSHNSLSFTYSWLSPIPLRTEVNLTISPIFVFLIFTLSPMTFLNFTIPNSSPMISYQGQWEDGPTINSSTCANQSISLQLQGTPSLKTNDGHAAATLAFLGTNITIYGETDNVFSVQLDKESLITVNGSHFWHDTSPFFLWSADNLNDTQHTVEISQLSSGGKSFSLDCISVGRDIGPPGYNGSISNMTIDDESSPIIVYTGSWTSSFSNSAFNDSIHSTSNEGSRAELEFWGSSIEIYGNGASFQIQVDNQLPMNLVGSQFDMSQSQGGPPGGLDGHSNFPRQGPPGSSQAGDPNSQFTGPTLLFYMDNLDENRTHVITLTNSQSNSPLFLDFAVIRGDQSVSAITPSPTLMTPIPTQNFDDHSNSKSLPIGIIIGSAVGASGFLILCLIGLYFLRRRRRIRKLRHYRSTVLTDDSVGAEDTPSRDTVTPVVEVTPYILPDVKLAQASEDASTPHPINSTEVGRADQDTDSSGSPEMDSPRTPALFTLSNNEIVEPNPQHEDQLPNNARNTEPNASFQNLSDQEEPLIGGIRERDAGRVMANSNRLPPAYDENWRHSYQHFSSQVANRDETIVGRDDIR